MSYVTLNEITSQPQAWRGALAELERQAAGLRAFFERHQPDQVLYVGCGSPYFLARTAASQSRELLGVPSEAHPASDIWLFPQQTLTPRRKSMMVMISRSGETTEMLRALQLYRGEYGQAVAAITCYEDSTLARTVQPTLLAREGQETGLAQTRSFTSMLLLTQGLIHAFANRPLSPRFRDLPELGQRLINDNYTFAEQFGRGIIARFKQVFFLGGGSLYGLACEAMLKMKEMSLSPSEAYHFMEFRHGPMSMVDSETLVVGMVSQATTAHETAVLTEMRGRGATVLALTPEALPAASADEQIFLPGGLTDLERAALYLPVLHLIIYAHTVQKALDPDRPHNLTAVISLDDQHTNKALGA